VTISHSPTAAPPTGGYGRAWLVGGTEHGRRLHTISRGSLDWEVRLSLQSALCGIFLDWFIPDETFITDHTDVFPLCQRCDARMR